MISSEPYRFSNLCREDKIRLQNLIQELAKASQSLAVKDKQIQELQKTLDQNKNEKSEIETQKNAALEKAEGTKQILTKFRTELKTQQDEISDQILKATKQIKLIKEKRHMDKKQFKRKEELLKKEIEHHIETARSTEDNAEKIRAELEKVRIDRKMKSETGAQTSFVDETSEEVTNDNTSDSLTDVPDKNMINAAKIEHEQKKMEKLIKQQGQLLRDAEKHRNEINLKLNLDLSETDSDSKLTPLSELPQTSDSLLDPQFIDLPKITPRSQAPSSVGFQNNTEQILSSARDESQRLASLLAELEMSQRQQEISNICNNTSYVLQTPRDQSVMRLVDLIDQLEITSNPLLDTASEISSIPEDTQITFDPEIEDIFFR